LTEAKELAESIGQEAQNQAAKIIEEAEEEAGRIIYEARKRAEEEAEEKVALAMENSKNEAAAIVETARKSISSEIEDFHQRFSNRIQNLISEIAAYQDIVDSAEVETEEDKMEALSQSIPFTEVGDSSNNGSNEELATDGDFESDLALAVMSQEEITEDPSATDSEYVTVEPVMSPDSNVLYDGQIELAMPPPVDMAQLIRFRRNLQSIKHLKVLRTTGSWNEGSIITALIDKPLPLIDLLIEMPEVEKAELLVLDDDTDTHFDSGEAHEAKSGSLPKKRIVVTLIEDIG